MSKGIRASVQANFIAMSTARLNGEFGEITNTLSPGNVKFRRAVCDAAVKDFGISLPSAGSAYNAAFQFCKVNHPELVVGLGRAQDKIGGRKRKNADPLAAEAGNVTPVEEVLVTLVKVKDGSVFATDLTVEEANSLIAEHAAKRNKPKLQIQEVSTEVTA